MAIINNDMMALGAKASSSFTQKEQEYNTKLQALEKERKAKESEIKNLQKLLDDEINIIQNPDLRAMFHSFVTNFSKGALTGGNPSYEKFVYYAQRINEMKPPKLLLKKYPNYCSTVLYSMAKEYVLLKKKLEADYNAIQPYYDKQKWALFDSYKSLLEKGMKALYTQAAACAQKEATSVINQIKQSV